MKSLQILAVGMAVSAALLCSAQRPHDQGRRQGTDQMVFKPSRTSNWGMRQESGLIHKLRLSGSEAVDVRNLFDRTERKLSGYSRGGNDVTTTGREFHLELARLLSHEHSATYSEAWRDAFRRHPEWLNWQVLVIKRNLPSLRLTGQQKDRINRLVSDYNSQFNSAVDYGSGAGERRPHFASDIDSAGNNFEQSVMATLDDRQRSRLRTALQRASQARSSEERFRDAWVRSL